MTKLLDCTLRDGGYYTHWDFPDPVVSVYTRCMNRLPIEYIEVGYRSIDKGDYLGEYFYLPIKTLERLKSQMPDKKLALMLNAKDCTLSNLPALLKGTEKYVDMVRMAIDPRKLEKGVDISKKIKDLGFEVTFNLMYVSRFQNSPDFWKQCERCAHLDYLYLVDSYGSAYPYEIEGLFKLFKQHTDISLGFHGHNNLELAFANTVSAIRNDASIADATIMGMGRGAGNLSTELILSYINSRQSVDLDFNALSEVLDSFSPLKEAYGWGTNLAYMVAGANDLPQQEVMTLLSMKRYSLDSIVNSIQARLSQKSVEYPSLEKIADRFKAVKKTIIVGGGATAADHAEDLVRLAHCMEDTIVIHSSTRNLANFVASEKEPIVCLMGNEGYKLDQRFSPEIKDKILACVLPASPRKHGTYVPDSIRDCVYENPLAEEAPEGLADSPLFEAIQASRALGAETIMLAGFDGYSHEGSMDYNIALETQAVVDYFSSKGVELLSVTPTCYENIKERSLFSILAENGL